MHRPLCATRKAATAVSLLIHAVTASFLHSYYSKNRAKHLEHLNDDRHSRRPRISLMTAAGLLRYNRYDTLCNNLIV